MYSYETTKYELMNGLEALPQEVDYIWVFRSLFEGINKQIEEQIDGLFGQKDEDKVKSINLTDYCVLSVINGIAKEGTCNMSRHRIAYKVGVSYSTVCKSIAKLKKTYYNNMPLLTISESATIGKANAHIKVNTFFRNTLSYLITSIPTANPSRVKIIPFLCRELDLTLNQYYTLECVSIMTKGMGGVDNKSYFTKTNSINRAGFYQNLKDFETLDVLDNFNINKRKLAEGETFIYNPDLKIIKASKKFEQAKQRFHENAAKYTYWEGLRKKGSAEAAEIMGLWEKRTSKRDVTLLSELNLTEHISNCFNELATFCHNNSTTHEVLYKIEMDTINLAEKFEQLLSYSDKINISNFKKQTNELVEQLLNEPAVLSEQQYKVFELDYITKGMNGEPLPMPLGDFQEFMNNRPELDLVDLFLEKIKEILPLKAELLAIN